MKTIDLHGLRHKDASALLTDCCSELDTPFEVITGHSHTMKKIVEAIAAEFNLTTRESIGNSGRIIVNESR